MLTLMSAQPSGCGLRYTKQVCQLRTPVLAFSRDNSTSWALHFAFRILQCKVSPHRIWLTICLLQNTRIRFLSSYWSQKISPWLIGIPLVQLLAWWPLQLPSLSYQLAIGASWHGIVVRKSANASAGTTFDLEKRWTTALAFATTRSIQDLCIEQSRRVAMKISWWRHSQDHGYDSCKEAGDFQRPQPPILTPNKSYIRTDAHTIRAFILCSHGTTDITEFHTTAIAWGSYGYRDGSTTVLIRTLKSVDSENIIVAHIEGAMRINLTKEDVNGITSGYPPWYRHSMTLLGSPAGRKVPHPHSNLQRYLPRRMAHWPRNIEWPATSSSTTLKTVRWQACTKTAWYSDQ